MSWLSSIFTPSGQNAADSQQRAQRELAGFALAPIRELGPMLADQARLRRSLEPMRARSVWDAMNSATPGGVRAGLELNRAGLRSRAEELIPRLRAALSRGGAGIGALQGAEAQALNDANSQGNDEAAYWYSPAGKAMIARMSQEAAGMAMPDLGPFSSLAAILQGWPKVNVGANPMSQILGTAGQLYGAGAFG